MKNKSVHICRFVHHAKFHCIMTTLKILFEIEFERGELEKSPISNYHILLSYNPNLLNYTERKNKVEKIMSKLSLRAKIDRSGTHENRANNL